MRQYRSAFALIICLALAACSAEPTASPTPVTVDSDWVDAETYEVYEAVILSEYGSTAVVLRPTTIQARLTGAAVPRAEERMPQLQVSTVRHFNRIGENMETIEDRF